MLRFWHIPKNGVVFRLFATYVSSLALGILMLGWVILRTVKEQRAEAAREFEIDLKIARAV